MSIKVKRAILSVTDKSGLESFAKELSKRGVELVATGGTASTLKEAGLEILEVSQVTGFPEIMDGRVKTLHPLIHGGILADRSKRDHLSQAEKHGIKLIDLVVVNLYRFRETVEKGLSVEETVEQIDIGGPTMVRAAAKNFHSVAVVVDPADYGSVIEELDKNGGSLSLEFTRKLAAKAFRHTAVYDAAICAFFDELSEDVEMSSELVRAYRLVSPLRYGENPHLKGALYMKELSRGGFSSFKKLQGKELSFNNIQDMHAAFMLARDLGPGSCAIIKHMNPCGAAVCSTLRESYERALKTDPVSAFGSVVALYGKVDRETAEKAKEIFLEVIVATGFDDEALEVLKKKKNLRLITIKKEIWEKDMSGWVGREVGDMLLLQEADEGFPELDEGWRVVTETQPDEKESLALKLAWKVVKHIRSNAIVICDHEGTIGVGAGQMSRVDSCRIAVDNAKRHGLEIKGSVAASDAFFPFPDGIEVLSNAGVVAVIQPGGSIRDEEVIKSANELGIKMVFTGRRHFKH